MWSLSSRKHYATRWLEMNVAVQCVGCNMFKSGEQYFLSTWMKSMVMVLLKNYT